MFKDIYQHVNYNTRKNENYLKKLIIKLTIEHSFNVISCNNQKLF